MDTLTSADRCDGCGAQAYVRFIKNSAVLDFCGHHTNKHADALMFACWHISMDTRSLLLGEPVKVG